MRTDGGIYRVDIDGLRAVAVLSVVLCHAGLSFPGGYVGVDVFFVISGYLIAGLILKEVAQGTFSLADFWERRVRRIVPALVTITLAVLVAGWFLLIPDAYESFGRSLVGLSLLVANVHFWRETGYFAEGSENNPMLHTWSLAVEEQFYFIVPVFLLVMARVRLPHRVFPVLAAASILSLGLSVYGTVRHPSATFYLLPTRAWELCAGVLLALRPIGLLVDRPRWREGAAALGLLLVLVPCFVYDKDTPFPGLRALPPVLGAVLLLASGGVPAGLPRANRFLAWGPLVFVGLISYSLYLWHWPLFVFARSQKIDALTPLEKAAILVISLVLSVLSWRFIERPFRSRRLLPSRTGLMAVTVLVFLGLMGSGLLLHSLRGFEGRLPPQALRFAATGRNDPRFFVKHVAGAVPLNLMRFGDASRPAELMVWGDSFALSILPVIEALCVETDVAAYAAAYPVTPPVIGYTYRSPHNLKERTIPFNDSVFQFVQKSKIRNVLLVANWCQYLKDDAFQPCLLKTVDLLREAGVAVYFLDVVPRFDFNVRKALVLYSWRGWDLSRLALTRSEHEQDTALQTALLPALQSRGVHVLDPVPTLRARNNSLDILPFDAGGSFYRDNWHLSTYGALAIKPLFSPLFRSITDPSGVASRTGPEHRESLELMK